MLMVQLDTADLWQLQFHFAFMCYKILHTDKHHSLYLYVYIHIYTYTEAYAN